MDEAESNPNSETPNLNVNETETKPEIKKDIDQTSNTEQVSAVRKDIKNEIVAPPDEIVAVEVSGEIKEQNMMEDDDGEDLPDNFFDDFSNNDFMAGLDIVDDWMDDEEDPEKRRDRDDYFQDDAELRAKSSERRPDLKRENRRESSPRHRPRYGIRDHYTKRDRFSKEDERYRRQRDRSFDRKSRDRDFDRRRSRDRDFERRRSRSRDRFRDERRSRERFRSRDRDRSKPKEHDRRSSDKNELKDRPLDENIDSRRDPEKTKRDIQRDKLRCAKDFEARVFQEQLKVAETGLVPPGTELDVVMEHEKRKLEEQAVVDNPPEHKNEEVLSPPRPVENKRSDERFRGRDKSHSKSHGRHSRDRHSHDRHSRERRSRDRHSRDRDLRVRRSRERDLRSRDRDLRDRRSRDRDLRDRRYSPDLRSRKREHNRFNRSRDRSLSPRFQRRSRSNDREEMYRRNDDLRLRIREKRRERYFNELSPVSEAKFSRSPSLMNLSLISNISEREFWLRNRDKYKSRYGRSCSPISSSSLSDHGSPRRKRSRKASFMEEIERKLRARAKTRTTSSANFGSPGVPSHEPPKPVPPPHQYSQQMPVNMAFQHQHSQMFPQGMTQSPYPQPQIVDHGMMMHPQQHQPIPLMSLMTAPPTMGTMPGSGILGVSPTMVEQPMIQMHQVVNPMAMQVQQPPALNSPVKLDSSLHRTESNLRPCVSDANKEVTKLFEEQKISLSDYLSVSAKPIDPKLPVINVHRKIKVISKCQDVIRVLKDDSKFCGRFFPRPAPAGLEKQEEKSMKWKSPLRKTFPVRFMFTTPCKKPPVQQDFVKNIINKLLFVCGIPALPGSDPPVSRSAGVKTANASTSSKPIPNIFTSQSNSTPKPVPAPISFSVAQQKPKNTPLSQQSVLIKRTTIGLQTDPVKCQICEIRSARKFSDQGCQTMEKDTADESTQVTNEDLQKSMVTFTPRGILKNSSSLQSLSHLTPAQLLSLQQEKTDDGWNIASRNDTFQASRNTQDQFGNSPGNFMGRNTGNAALNSNFGSNMNNQNMGRSNTNMPGNNFNSNFTGSMDKQLPFSNMQNRSFSCQLGNQTTMNPGSSMNDFQNMANRNADNRSGNFDRFPNDRYSPEQSFNDPNNMNFNNRNMGSPMNSNRGRGGTANRGFFMSYGGQNRPFYNN